MHIYHVNVNGMTYEVKVEEIEQGKNPAAQPATAAKAEAAPKAAPAPQAGTTQVKAPIAGTILSVNVTEGKSVKRGDVLMILEAMKMENEIMSPVDGVVSSVMVAKGSSVNSGDILVVIG